MRLCRRIAPLLSLVAIGAVQAEPIYTEHVVPQQIRSAWMHSASTDIDKDGDDDFVAIHFGTALPLKLGWFETMPAGTAAFVEHPIGTLASNSSMGGLALLDADRDGDLEVATVAQPQAEDCTQTPSEVRLWQRIDATQWQSTLLALVPCAVTLAALRDGNDPGIVVIGYGDGRQLVFDAPGSLVPVIRPSGLRGTALHVADIDLDGDDDVLTNHGSQNSRRLHLNTGGGPSFTAVALPGVAIETRFVTVGPGELRRIAAVRSANATDLITVTCQPLCVATSESWLPYWFSITGEADIDRDGDLDLIGLGLRQSELRPTLLERRGSGWRAVHLSNQASVMVLPLAMPQRTAADLLALPRTATNPLRFTATDIRTFDDGFE